MHLLFFPARLCKLVCGACLLITTHSHFTPPALSASFSLSLFFQNERLFSPAEEAQLQSLFCLSEEGLCLALGGLCYIFEQAAFQNVGPEPLYEQLQEAGIDDAHAKVRCSEQWLAM